MYLDSCASGDTIFKDTNMRVVIVGGTGHISSSIVPELLDLGHEVTCFNRGNSNAFGDGVQQIIGDRYDYPAFEKIMQQQNFDAAIDMITFNAADAASSLRAFPNVQHLIHCSTVCTYGNTFEKYPVDEDIECQPFTEYGINKHAADELYRAAHAKEGYPVTIAKPSTTCGVKNGLLRQINLEFDWIDRIRKGLPILICDGGMAMHQFMHVDDVGRAFAKMIGNKKCVGQTYNVVPTRCWSWHEFHTTAMEVLGNTVELVSLSFDQLKAGNIPGFEICEEIFSDHSYYSGEKLLRDLDNFAIKYLLPQIMQHTFEGMDRQKMIPEARTNGWEDALIKKYRE